MSKDEAGTNQVARYFVTSRNGVPIMVSRSGSGPSLLLVHGMVADHSTTWRRVLPGLEQNFTVHAMDRRGRGGSGDDPGYDLSKEAEDVAAVVDEIGEPVFVVGHSYGALCALEGALLTDRVERLALYEGAIVQVDKPASQDAIEALRVTSGQGDLEALLWAFLRDFAGLAEQEIGMLRADEEGWQVRMSNAATILREIEAEGGYSFDPDRCSRLSVPTLLLVGGDSPRREREGAEILGRSLLDAELRILEGQGHVAMYTAPDLFVSALLSFADDGRT